MSEPLETPVPPVIDSLERKSSVKPLVYTVILIIILILALVGYKLFGTSTKTNNQIVNVQTTPTQVTNQDAVTNNNNKQLIKDTQVIDTQTTNLDSDLKNIDQGLNDQAVNLE
jgi:hypothetical protein